MSRRLNILFVMVDQLSPNFLAIHGHPLVKTPHLDALAAEGAVFDAAYSNYPICAPSRFSMLSGRLASSIGTYDNGSEFRASVPTLMHYLRAVGYHTSLCGKMHIIGPDQFHGYEDRITTDIYPTDFGWSADWRAGTPEIPESPTGINPRSVIEAGVCARSMQIDFDDEVAHPAVRKIYDLAREQERMPFFLTVSFTHPHNPFVTTREYWDRYDHEAIDMPRVGPIPLGEMDDHSRRLFHLFRLDEYRVTEAHVRNARHAYYGMISYCDDKLGMLVSALKDSGLYDDTVIVFTADHGEMMGERGLWYKQSFSENAIRVPLVVRLPYGRRSTRIPNPVSLLDLAPTLLDLATEGNPPEPIDPLEGASMVGLLSGERGGWRDIVHAEFFAEGTFAPCLMVRKGRHKYVHCETDRPLLFDLEVDPMEAANLAGSSAHRDIEIALYDEVMRRWRPHELREQILASQKRQLFLHRVLGTGQAHPWDFQPWRDASKQYVRGGAKTTLVKGRARLPYVEPAKPDTPRRDGTR